MDDRHKPIQLAYSSFEPSLEPEETVPIIFMHGITLTKEDWGDIPQITANATGRMVYAIDARNHGDSEWVDHFDFHINVDDILLFMDRMNIQRGILVGHNMGAVTALKVARRNPERVEKLILEEMPLKRFSEVLISSSVKYLTIAKEAVNRIPVVSSMDEAKEFLRDYAFNRLPSKLKFGYEYNSSDGCLALKQKEDGRFEFKCNLDVVLPVFQNINKEWSSSDGTFSGPTCFIYGNNSSNLIGLEEYNIKKLFPNAEVVGIKDASHEVHKQFPLPFTEALLVFIQGGWHKKIYNIS